ncbi:hypothetical protein, partial [Bacillus velezensis]|uniref:hypothetical protein n=1 Tax=Bacillus velezensis TaxID=492670 RepID=UPI0021B50A57
MFLRQKKVKIGDRIQLFQPVLIWEEQELMVEWVFLEKVGREGVLGCVGEKEEVGVCFWWDTEGW